MPPERSHVVGPEFTIAHPPCGAHSICMARGKQLGFVLAVVLAAAAHLVAGYFYVASGLMAPLWAVVLLLVWWVVLSGVGVRLVQRRSFLVLLVPVVAAVTWVGLMAFGGQVLGWTP